MLRIIQEYIKEVENQRLINRVFLCAIILVMGFRLLYKASFTILSEPLFFITSDAFEFALTCSLALWLYYVISPSESLRKRFLGIFVALALLLVLAYLKDFRRGQSLDSIWSEFSSFVGVTFLFASLFYVFDNLNLLINNSYEKTKMALRKAENKLLRQQLNPHFLFNAFNSLYSMSLSNNPKTSESILKMSGMMRYITDEINVAKTLLRKELKFIEDYISIEKLRFGESSDILFQVEGRIESIFIEPLLLIPLVENAFKHGFYTNNDDAFVHIVSNVSAEGIDFKVTNRVVEKQHFQNQTREGKGLELLRKRLNLAYGEKAILKIEEEDQIFKATLKIDLK